LSTSCRDARFAGDYLKIFMEAGKVIKAAFIAKLFDAVVVFDQQFAGVPYADLDQELRIGLSCPGFEVTTERIRTDIGH